MTRKEKTIGYIYKITNTSNGKVYIGKVETERFEKKGMDPIQGRWKEHIKKVNILERKRDRNPDKRIKASHLKNAISKYGTKNFIIEKIDDAKDLKELNEKEKENIKKYDSMNPDKGYNMTEGGDFGRLRPELLNDPEFREKQRNATKQALEEVYKNPNVREEHREHTSKAIKEKYEDKEYKERQREGVKEKWKDPKYQEKLSQGVKEKWKDPEYRSKFVKEISNKKEFLQDIKNKQKVKELVNKYGMSENTIKKRIQEMFGPNGPKNYTELKEHLQDKNIDDVLKEIEEKNINKQDKTQGKENSADGLPTESNMGLQEKDNSERSKDKDEQNNNVDGDSEKDSNKEPNVVDSEIPNIGNDFEEINEFSHDEEGDIGGTNEGNNEKGRDFVGINNIPDDYSKDYEGINEPSERPKDKVDAGEPLSENDKDKNLGESGPSLKTKDSVEESKTDIDSERDNRDFKYA